MKEKINKKKLMFAVEREKVLKLEKGQNDQKFAEKKPSTSFDIRLHRYNGCRNHVINYRNERGQNSEVSNTQQCKSVRA